MFLLQRDKKNIFPSPLQRKFINIFENLLPSKSCRFDWSVTTHNEIFNR